MEGNNRRSSDQQQVQVAPFMAKTYQMVNDPRTDYLIRWGRENNSFLVLEPLKFSRRLLPVYFKHNNFSSFVRQLNTYGFRKVDSDKWEFAHESFLRGQINLLPRIVRRKKSIPNSAISTSKVEESDEEQMLLLMELGRLRQEQRSLDQELYTMGQRLQATEGRSQQMMSFLSRVVEDPDRLLRLTLAKKERQLMEKRRRLLIPPLSPSPPLPCPPNTATLHPFGGLLTVTTVDYSAHSEPVNNTASAVVDDVPLTTIPHFRDMTSSMVVDSGGLQTLFQPESTVERGTSTAAAAANPLSTLGHWYY